MRLFKLASSVLILIAISGFSEAAATAATGDIGEIAVIEDVDGTILSVPGALMPNVFLANVTCAFYLTHLDEYDGVFIFNTSVTNIQQGWPVHSPSEGIGRGIASQGEAFCSYGHRLRQAVNMGNVNALPPDPDDIASIVPFYPLTGIELQAHEFGHQWLASVDFDKDDGNGAQCLLRGYEPSRSGRRDGDMCNGGNMNDFNQHWSYDFNSCSLMYGSCIEDLGGGNFRYTYDLGSVKYSQLDQYLMGLRTAAEVDPMFVVWTGSVDGTSSIPIQHGSSAERSGERIDVSIDDIIRQEGPRNPELEECHWKAAFILVHPAGAPPFPAQVEQVDTYRQRWEVFYDWATDNRGSFDTTLDGCGTGTQTCPGEASPQCGAPVCTDGEKRCSGAVVMICEDGEWVFHEECQAGTECVVDECVGIPEDGDQAEVPEEDEKDGGPDTDGDYEDGRVDGDDTAPVSCTVGEAFCEGDIYVRCNRNGDGWDMLDCAEHGQTCDDGLGCVGGGGSASSGGGGCAHTGSGANGLVIVSLILLLAVSRRLRESDRAIMEIRRPRLKA